MPYLDGTEEPPPAPQYCPACRGRIVTKWTTAIQWRKHRGNFAIAVPVHVCEKCKIAVRIHELPDRPICATRKAARASRAKEIKMRNERRDALRRTIT
jgi:hypothetical protein